MTDDHKDFKKPKKIHLPRKWSFAELHHTGRREGEQQEKKV